MKLKGARHRPQLFTDLIYFFIIAGKKGRGKSIVNDKKPTVYYYASCFCTDGTVVYKYKGDIPNIVSNFTQINTQ